MKILSSSSEKLFFCSLLFILTGLSLRSASCTASSGLYSNPATWSCGHVPQNGDDIIIPAGVSVEVDITTALLSNTNIYVSGELNFDNAAKIKLDCSCSVWVLPGGDLTGGNGGSKIEYCGDPNAWQGGQTTNGPFTIGNTPMPVELISFEGTPENTNVQLTWSTASETNNSYFTLERSTNGFSFEEIGHVTGSGTSSQQHNYSFVDTSPFLCTNYYRLKQTDFNGQTMTFETIAVEFSNGVAGCTLTVYPNPCETNCTVTLSDCPEDNDGNIAVQVIDGSGKNVMNTIPERNAKGGFTYAIDVNDNLKPGVYIIRAQSSKSIYQQKAVLK